MSPLREEVKIVTLSGEIRGYLYVGVDGLPELHIHHPRRAGPPCGVEKCSMAEHGAVPSRTERYRPATFPAEWRVMSPTGGTLYGAWDLIRSLVEEIALAQREADDEDRDRTQQPDDEITAFKRDADARGER